MASATATAAAPPARQCSLSAAQAEEVFEKLLPQERKQFAEWCAQQTSEGTVLAADSAHGRPERWMVRTIDTGRWRAFAWPSMMVRFVPEAPSTEAMFKMAMGILRDAAVPLALLHSQYEHAGPVLVLAAQAPLACLQEFARVQAAQNVEESVAAQTQLKRTWADAGIDPDQFQSFAHALLKLRADHDPPYILLFSRVDKAALVLVCRHADQIGVFQRSIPGIGRMPFEPWPILEHSAATAIPRTLCQHGACAKGKPADPALLATFATHRGVREREAQSEAEREARRRWETELNPAMQAEMDAAEQSGGDVLAIQERYANMSDELEAQLYQQMLARTDAALAACAGCKKVAYCSRECQTADWARHRPYCRPPKPAGAAA